jgi:hypothetical protein
MLTPVKGLGGSSLEAWCSWRPVGGSGWIGDSTANGADGRGAEAASRGVSEHEEENMEEASPLRTHGRIRMSWHGAAVTADGDRRLWALRRERGHHVVTGLVASDTGLGDCGAGLKKFGH